jgi:XRE family transcriptional regulator, aerobic/anaerobic benzoate catabolism transcriptional regulator
VQYSAESQALLMNKTTKSEDVTLHPAEARDLTAANFLHVVGGRVRAARMRKNMSRKQLAEASGVSQRYLAQLEAGAGNISIVLLKRVADALGSRIEGLMRNEPAPTAEDEAFAALFRSAGPVQRRRALEALDPDHSSLARARRIAMIGLRGAGKSTLGRLSAASLGAPFVELNAEIAETSGMPVAEVMALYGQEGYRRLERQALEHVAATHDVVVLAVAGGVVSEPDTFSYLLRCFHTIWLKAKPEEHMARVRNQGDTRPMAGNPAAMDELKAILVSRESLYARSEAQVDTSGRSVEESLADVLRTIEEAKFWKG